jgi:hypothetical protein
VDRDGAFTSRRGPGEGSVARRQTPDSCAGWRIRRDKNRLHICATRRLNLHVLRFGYSVQLHADSAGGLTEWLSLVVLP